MKKQNVLLTGGAGFIGSNLLKSFIQDDRIASVKVLDNLSTGSRLNLENLLPNKKVEFVWGDIREYSTCHEVCKGIDLVCHQAALGSVPRSIKSPVTTNNVNITGTLNVFTAAKENGVKRIVYAASSSTYGDSTRLPKVEDSIGDPISPYAVTKLVNELYANVFAKLYDIEFIGLRYFNVFGPNQDPNGAYAAVIPLFVKAILNNNPSTINGDGSQSRDFTYVENVVQANKLAMFTDNKNAVNQVYNIACGQRITIVDLYNTIKNSIGSNLEPNFGPARIGDVLHSLADISKAQNLLGYNPTHNVHQGIEKAIEWYKVNKKTINQYL